MTHNVGPTKSSEQNTNGRDLMENWRKKICRKKLLEKECLCLAYLFKLLCVEKCTRDKRLKYARIRNAIDSMIVGTNGERRYLYSLYSSCRCCCCECYCCCMCIVPFHFRWLSHLLSYCKTSYPIHFSHSPIFNFHSCSFCMPWNSFNYKLYIEFFLLRCCCGKI